MNLKESYRYSKFLDTLLEASYAFLNDKSFVTTTTEKHLRSKTYSEAQDETLVVKKPDVDFDTNRLIDFVVEVLDERDRLLEAIALAKSKTEFNIDNAISMNKKKQSVARLFTKMAGIKSSESVSRGTGYRFNNEMNQVPYYYDIEKITEIDYNRNDVRNLAKKYFTQADEISSKIDAIEINTEVPFTCKWDVNDSFDNIVAVQ